MRQRAVVITRRTELDELLDRHATRGQAEFFLKSRGRTLADVQDRHDHLTEAVATINRSIPQDWATASVEREDLSRFLFAPEDTVVVVGQDGLVANTAKYVTTQLVIGVNPEPGINPGVLVRHTPENAGRIVGKLGENVGALPAVEYLTMVEGHLDDGQEIRALNELFIGHPSHQSARYTLGGGEYSERQSSSGLIVGTGTGATGWLASISRDRGGRSMPRRDQAALAWFVREAWPSPATGANFTEGVLLENDALSVTVESDQLVAFGDGIEADRLLLGWGQTLQIRVSGQRFNLAA